MSKRLFVCALVLVCLLSGCANQDEYPAGMRVECQDLILTLPGDFSDLSAESVAQGADFMYGRNTLVLVGLAEEKAGLKAMTLAEYTDYVIRGNKLSCSAVPAGDGYLLTYEKTVDNTAYTYTIATFEGKTNFWILQFYGPTADLQENQPEIDIILEGVQPKAG